MRDKAAASTGGGQRRAQLRGVATVTSRGYARRSGSKRPHSVERLFVVRRRHGAFHTPGACPSGVRRSAWPRGGGLRERCAWGRGRPGVAPFLFCPAARARRARCTTRRAPASAARGAPAGRAPAAAAAAAARRATKQRTQCTSRASLPSAALSAFAASALAASGGAATACLGAAAAGGSAAAGRRCVARGTLPCALLRCSDALWRRRS